MAEISKTYASPGLRWGLYRHDHPNADDPKYDVVTGDSLGIPPEFAGGDGQDFSGLFILCTIDPRDGSPQIEAWKEIPNKEHTRSGIKDFARTPENWRKLCTQALGRALKAAGYPDDTTDLKALLLWRQRSIELEMLAKGGPLAELGTGVRPDNGELEAAAKSSPVEEHPEVVDEEDDEFAEPPVGAGLADGFTWSDEARELLRPVVAQMTGETMDEFEAWCDQRGDSAWSQLTGGKLRTVASKASSLVAKQGQLIP